MITVMPVAPEGLSNSLLDFTRDLVRVPSRGGIDPYSPVLELIQRWLGLHGIPAEIICLPEGKKIAVVASVGTPGRGPNYLLNAPADTADFGDESAWSCDPLAAVVRDGWLFGRGCADSKAGVSMFCHIAAALKTKAEELNGSVTVVFDTEEHTGTFLGIRRFFESRAKNSEIRAAFIGYPGQDRIIIGCRGFHRATIRVHGQAAHSGSSRLHGINAITRAVRLVATFQQTELPAAISERFPLPPQLTITHISGGHGFSGVPDLCTVNIDIRLTPTFGATQAHKLLVEGVQRLDQETVRSRATEIETLEGFGAYVLDPDSALVRALQTSAQRVLGHPVPTAVAGPSSIGNYLASLGIPATSGFGVIGRNFHAADECMAVDSILPAYQVYWGAIQELLGTVYEATS
jgi:succinyl-diaminopimelate desuccinylase